MHYERYADLYKKRSLVLYEENKEDLEFMEKRRLCAEKSNEKIRNDPVLYAKRQEQRKKSNDKLYAKKKEMNALKKLEENLNNLETIQNLENSETI